MSDVAALLTARAEIDRALMDLAQKQFAIMFTDIVGSTAFFEARGDIAGLARVKRHNDLLFPIVQAHDGRVIKTIGDAIMAVYADPARAVAAGIAMQQTLLAAQAGEDDPIRIRIGVHFGAALVDSGDVFGDAVNTAARVESAAEGDELLVSAPLMEELASRAPQTIGQRDVAFKGKQVPMRVFSVRWRPHVAVAESDRHVVLDVRAVDDDTLQMTLREHDTVLCDAVSGASVAGWAAEVTTLSALFAGQRTEAYRKNAEAQLQALFARAVPPALADALAALPAQTFIGLRLDAKARALPIEALMRGAHPMGVHYCTGRLPLTPGAHDTVDGRGEGPVVIVADPTEDLPAAAREGELLAGLLRERNVHVELLQGPVQSSTFRDAFGRARVLHYAGHADARTNAVRLSDGPMSLSSLQTERGPAFVFTNACRSSRQSGAGDHAPHAWSGSVGGHHLAPLFDVDDDDATFFALRVYEALVTGQSLGASVRHARQKLAEHDAAALGHLSYVLDGDPATTLFAAGDTHTSRLRANSNEHLIMPGASVAATSARPRTDTLLGAPPTPTAAPALNALTIGAFVVVVLGLGGAIWALSKGRDVPQPPTRAPTAAVASAPLAAAAPKPAPVRAPFTGPVRVSVVAFKNFTGDDANDRFEAGFAETLSASLVGHSDIALVERVQLDVDIGELDFSQSKYVDPKTRAAMGRIQGVEVLVLGGIQRAGDKMRATARFVKSETGEVVAQAKADGSATDIFALQDGLADALKVAAAKINPARIRVQEKP